MNDQQSDVSVAGILERWADGTLSTTRAISLGQFDGFTELLEAAINSGIPLRTKLMPYEEEQARRFTELMQQSP